jgi:voltage-gated potassium channel
MSAGANSVVLPNLIGGLRMTSEMVRPSVVSFLDMMLKEGKGDLRVEDVEVKNPKISTVSEVQFEKTGVLLLAVATKQGYKFNPPKDTSIQAGDKLIVMGSADQVLSLKNLL